MNKFLYPADLVKICRESWEKSQKRATSRRLPSGKEQFQDDSPPFPSDSQLLDLLETIYHVSFLAEEGRRIAVRLIYVLPETFEHSRGLNLHQQPARLHRPAQLSVSELLKLAPAVQAAESAIMVAPSESLGGNQDGLMLWGVLHLGTEWWRVMTGAASAALCPPDCLTISSFAPGSLTLSRLGSAIARLRNGKLIGTPMPDLDAGPVGQFLSPAAQELYNETVRALGQKKYASQKDSDQHPTHLYYRTLARLLHLIREQRHGGTLLILPDELCREDGRVVDRLAIKYSLDVPSIWETLIEEGVASAHYYRIAFPKPNRFLPHDSSASASELKEMIDWEKRQERSEEKIAEFCSFVAALSAVDGAVVMSRRLRVLGFGAEIIASSPSLLNVKDALDASAAQATSVAVQRFGTRHRSAMRMCSSFEDCVALVVSQDGPVKAMKRVGADVVMWNDVTLGRLAI
jgi:hypothetical protein